MSHKVLKIIHFLIGLSLFVVLSNCGGGGGPSDVTPTPSLKFDQTSWGEGKWD